MKPLYRVPSMTEIRALPKNGYSVISTFSGCGGSCLGFRMAGFSVRVAVEFIERARETYAANFPGVPILDRDIRTITGAELLATAELARGGVDVIEGSPPCSSFSTAGKRSKHWRRSTKYSSTKQRTDDLFFEFIRLVDEIQPRAFVAENVTGLVKGVAKGYFKIILSRFREIGYSVSARVVDASWLGVPQKRERLIFIGFRSDLGIEPVFPKPLSYSYSFRNSLDGRDEIPGLYRELLPGQVIRTLYDWCVLNGSTNIEDAAAVLKGRRYGFNHYLCALDRPVHTITQTDQHYHPFIPRTLTIPELRRVCSFPDDFIATGKFTEQWERFGRAVPPLMMRAIALRVRESLECVDG